MKTSCLHLPSAAVGLGVSALLLLSLGAAPQATQVPSVPSASPRPGVGFFQPHPRDLVTLEAYGGLPSGLGWPAAPIAGYDSQVLTVPAGEILVLTGVTTSNPLGSIVLLVDGRPLNLDLGAGTGVPNVARSFASGIPLREGTTVQVVRQPIAPVSAGNLGDGEFAWLHGYLANA